MMISAAIQQAGYEPNHEMQRIWPLAERSDIQPFQSWEAGIPPTQGGASLTLGFKIEPAWGSRSKPRRNSEMGRWAHINGHARDADAISIGCSDGNDVAFVARPEMTEGRP